MNRIVLSAVVLTSLMFQACSSKVYNNKSFLEQVNLEGKKVAILPAEVELTGRMPSTFSESKKLLSEESESILIQSQIYSQYLFKSKSGSKKKKHVELMNVDQVNNQLKNAGIDVRQSWNISADSLGKVIGADIVLRTKIRKNRIMSDAASFGIGAASTILGAIINPNNQGSSVSGAAKTYNMFFEVTLSDVNTHAVITKFTHEGDASWNKSPEKIVEASGRKIVRKGVIYAQK